MSEVITTNDKNDAGTSLINAIAEAVALKVQRMERGPRMLNVDQAAEYLGMTVEGLRKRAGRDIPTVDTDRRLRFDKRELDHWIDQAPRKGL